MSVLNKLQFSGFRSFAPGDEDVQTIQFKTPVTLFLGDNGSGKTTIIEVLKFATSGIFPTGSKQGYTFFIDNISKIALFFLKKQVEASTLVYR